jgi:hypothetical protein
MKSTTKQKTQGLSLLFLIGIALSYLILNDPIGIFTGNDHLKILVYGIAVFSITLTMALVALGDKIFAFNFIAIYGMGAIVWQVITFDTSYPFISTIFIFATFAFVFASRQAALKEEQKSLEDNQTVGGEA